VRAPKVGISALSRKTRQGRGHPAQLVFCLRKLAGTARSEGNCVLMFRCFRACSRPELKEAMRPNDPERGTCRIAVEEACRHPSRGRDVLGKPSSTLSSRQNSTDIADLSVQYCSHLRQPVSMIPPLPDLIGSLDGTRPHLRKCASL
jgi:hypothetical protein